MKEGKTGKTGKTDGMMGKSMKIYENPENQWIGLRENLQESPIFHGKIYMVSCRFSPTNQSIEIGMTKMDGGPTPR